VSFKKIVLHPKPSVLKSAPFEVPSKPRIPTYEVNSTEVEFPKLFENRGSNRSARGYAVELRTLGC
jgi:hypothetical protein